MTYLDEHLFNAFEKLPTLAFPRLVDQDRAALELSKAQFLADGTPPVFSYTKALEFDVASYLATFQRFDTWLDEQTTEPEVIRLYKEKSAELQTRAHLIDAMQRADDHAVTAYAKTLFGPPHQTLQELNEEFQGVLSRAGVFQQHKTPVNAEKFSLMVRRILDHYGLSHWNIRLTKSPSVSVSRSTVRVPRGMAISRARAARLLTHEVEVHALRSANGEASPLRLLGRGMANYIVFDEGLAIYYQQQLRSPDAIDPGFWDAWAVALSAEYPFSETFSILHDARLKLGEAMHEDDPKTTANDSAWRLCVRVYRGITNPEQPGVGFQRDHVYRTGLHMVREAVDTHGPSVLPRLFAGHAHINHLPALAALDIPPGRTPDMISREVVREIMRETKKRA